MCNNFASEREGLGMRLHVAIIAEQEVRQQIVQCGVKCQLAYIYISVTLQVCN